MNQDYSLVIDILKIFAIFYAILPISVTFYGIHSIISRSARVFEDKESSYGYSKPMTIINSVLSNSFSPFVYHRVIPHDSKEITDAPAIIMGIIYICIGIMLFVPLAWAYLTFK